jgi:predicted nucleotide-binding protein
MGQNFNRNEPPLRDISWDQVRLNDKIGKKIYATNKLLENINAKMDNFIVAKQNQPSFNKMLETQIQQISATLPSQSNGDSSKTPVQESVGPSSLCSRKRLQNLLKDLWEESVRIRCPAQLRIFL